MPATATRRKKAKLYSPEWWSVHFANIYLEAAESQQYRAKVVHACLTYQLGGKLSVPVFPEYDPLLGGCTAILMPFFFFDEEKILLEDGIIFSATPTELKAAANLLRTRKQGGKESYIVAH